MKFISYKAKNKVRKLRDIFKQKRLFIVNVSSFASHLLPVFSDIDLKVQENSVYIIQHIKRCHQSADRRNIRIRVGINQLKLSKRTDS